MRARSDIERRTAVAAADRPVRRALGAVILLLAFGTCGFMWIEAWDFWQSVSFTVITLSTVGYGDYGLSEAGLRFATMLILGGLGVMTYSVGQLAPMLFNQHLAREWKMNRQIHMLSDHFIVCGAGRVGRSVCTCLAQEGVPFIAVDPDRELIEEAIEHGMLAIIGDAASDDVLMEAGIERARAIACVTNSDTENIVITLSARQLNPEIFIISRAEEPSTVHKVRKAGATRVLSPIRAGGESIANSMVKPHLAELLQQGQDVESGIELAEVIVRGETVLDGRTIRDCGMAHESVVFVALKHEDGNVRFRPKADEALRPGDVLMVAGDALAVGRLQDDARGARLAA